MRPEVGRERLLVVISDVSTMKTNGARNAIATAISTLWFATRDQQSLPAYARRAGAGGRSSARRRRAARHRGTAWCTHLRELRTITSVTANDTTSSSIAIADA